MSEEKFRQDLARLRAWIAIEEARIVSDPLPHLERMAEYCLELLRVLDAVKYALSPDIVFDYAMERGMNPRDINGEAWIRCQEALTVLNNYATNKKPTKRGGGIDGEGEK